MISSLLIVNTGRIIFPEPFMCSALYYISYFENEFEKIKLQMIKAKSSRLSCSS